MGIEELNFSSAVLQGSAFSGLADLVADLAGQTDLSNTVGLTYTDMQNLVKSFGLKTIAKLGAQGKIDASNQLLWTLPLSEVKKLNAPVVFGSNIVRDVFVADETQLEAGDQHFYEGLLAGYKDISSNKVSSGNIVDDQGNAVSGTGYKFPAGDKLDAINWFDLSAVVKAKNIRFDNNSNVTDISAVYHMFHDICGGTAETLVRSGDRLDDATIGYGSESLMDISFDERDRDYLNFLNLFVPTPTFKDVSKCGIASVAPYLEAGLFKSNVGYGLNKEYLTLATNMRNVIRNKVRGSNTDRGANLTNEFQIMKEYGFPKNKVYEAYAAELAFGVSAFTGSALTSSNTANTDDLLDGPEDIQAQFASVYGSSGVLSDQLTDFEQDDTFNNSDGIKLANVKAATNVKSWVGYINAVKAFINSDQDYNWSTTGIAGPVKLVGSKQETWNKFQKVLALDPRLSGLPDIVLSTEQDERLRILLETIGGVDAGNNASFSNWAENNMTLRIDASAVYIKDGKFKNANNKSDVSTTSIFAAAVKHKWSDATEVYANLKGSGLFMMDSVYNVRSRINELDIADYTSADNAGIQTAWMKDSAARRSLLHKNKTAITIDSDSGSKSAYQYFTPGHFQAAFFDPNNLQHTANVALRYFDLDSSSNAIDDVSRNIVNVGGVVNYRLPLRTMDPSTNAVATNYADLKQHSRIGWVYNELVKKSFNNTKAAIAEITSWRPVPPQLYVDISDVTGFVKESELVTLRQKTDLLYNAAQATYENRSLPGAMVHVMANYLAKAGDKFSPNKEADLIALIDLHPSETLNAFAKMNQNLDSTNVTDLFTIGSSDNIGSNSDAGTMLSNVIQAFVHYGKPTSFLSRVGANAKRTINAYETEVLAWAVSSTTNALIVFGDEADVFSAVQHIGYWVPYLSQYTPEEIAEEAATDDDIQNISDNARALMLGLLLAATRGTLVSSKPGDAAARIAGLNAFHAAGIPRTLVDIAYTYRGTNVFTNMVGSNYDQ